MKNVFMPKAWSTLGKISDESFFVEGARVRVDCLAELLLENRVSASDRLVVAHHVVIE